MSKPINYVAGFVFTEDRKHVLLIKKIKPKWMAGQLNAIGGKIEEGESQIDAMIRECKEETNLDIQDWKLFTILYFQGSAIWFFKTFTDDIYNFKQMEAEEIVIKDITGIFYGFCNNYNVVPNLMWLIPLALDKDDVAATVINPS